MRHKSAYAVAKLLNWRCRLMRQIFSSLPFVDFRVFTSYLVEGLMGLRNYVWQQTQKYRASDRGKP